MKLATHVATSSAAAYLAVGLVRRFFPSVFSAFEVSFWLAVLFISALLQVVLDNIGHDVKVRGGGGYYYSRNRVHSLSGISVLSMVFALPALQQGATAYVLVALVFFAALLTHLLLDLVTEGGIYVRGRRIKFLRIRYDSPLANSVAIAMFALAVYADPLGTWSELARWSIILLSLYTLLAVI